MFGAPNFDEGTEKTPSYMDFELKLWPLESFLEIVAEDAWYSIVSERLGFVHAFRFVSFRFVPLLVLVLLLLSVCFLC